MYSLYALRTAIKEGNIYKFEYYFDMDKVYSSVFDDIMSDAYRKNNDDSIWSALAFGMMNSVKPNFILQMKEATKDGITGNVKLRQSKDANVNSIIYDSISYTFLAFHNSLNSSESGLELKKYEVLNKEEYSSNVRVIIRNAKTDKEVVLDLLLSKSQDDKWKVIKITNFMELIYSVKSDTDRINNNDLKKSVSKATAKNLQTKTKAKQSKGDKKSFTEEQIKSSSFVRERLNSGASNVEHKEGKTKFNFTGSSVSEEQPISYVKILNTVDVDDKTGKVDEISLIILVTGKKEYSDYDSILFSSDNGYYTIDIPAWEKLKMGFKVDPNLSENSASGIVLSGTGFGSKISYLREAFKILGGKNSVISFFKGNKALAKFKVDGGKIIPLIESNMLVEIMTKKLSWDDEIYLY